MLKYKLDNMTRYVRMLNNGSDMLDEILENGEKKAMGFDYSSMNNNVKVATKKFVTTEKKIEFLMKDNMSQHPIQHVHLITQDTRNLLRDVIIVVDMVA